MLPPRGIGLAPAGVLRPPGNVDLPPLCSSLLFEEFSLLRFQCRPCAGRVRETAVACEALRGLEWLTSVLAG
ncbi:MAG: hypothetical protein ACHQ2Y_02315 [Candidatus Lutacidiplasmatales archaeon]